MTGEDRWQQLNRCPECGREMQRDLAVGERLGLFYTCPEHGGFRYSWDDDRLEAVVKSTKDDR
jgi:hypothetical protein